MAPQLRKAGYGTGTNQIGIVCSGGGLQNHWQGEPPDNINRYCSHRHKTSQVRGLQSNNQRLFTQLQGKLTTVIFCLGKWVQWASLWSSMVPAQPPSPQLTGQLLPTCVQSMVSKHGVATLSMQCRQLLSTGRHQNTEYGKYRFLCVFYRSHHTFSQLWQNLLSGSQTHSQLALSLSIELQLP